MVGDPSVFAIESSITQPYSSAGQRALGFFVVHVGGERYGVRAPTATLLACSFDAVARRITRRGHHRVAFGVVSSAKDIADCVVGALYDDDRQKELFFGMSAEGMRTALALSEVLWAPDGDEAFDDGSHVLQFDQGDQVRLIAFRNGPTRDDVANTLREVWMNSNEFYDLLSKWRSGFEARWNLALTASKH